MRGAKRLVEEASLLDFGVHGQNSEREVAAAKLYYTPLLIIRTPLLLRLASLVAAEGASEEGSEGAPDGCFGWRA